MKVQDYTASKKLEVGSFIKAFLVSDKTKEQFFQVVQIEGSNAICLCSIQDGIVKLREIHNGANPPKPYVEIGAFQEALARYLGANSLYQILDTITFGN